LKGLTAGVSGMAESITADGTIVKTSAAYHWDTKTDKTYGYYGTYSIGNLRIDAEYRRNWRVINPTNGVSVPGGNPVDVRSWYASASYRICKYLELGTYHSRFYSNWAALRSANNNHIFDQALTARVDLTRYWNIKVEEHLMDGYGAGGTFRGFYTGLNPSGLQPQTHTLIVRTGVNF
jgi:hypothetical protein